MDSEGIVSLFRRLGSEVIRPYSGNVSVSCPFAPWYHASGRDRNPSMSVKIVEDGASVYYCFTCGVRGILPGLVTRLNLLRGDGSLDLLVEEVSKRESMDLVGQVERAIARFKSSVEREKVEREKQNEFVWDESELVNFVGVVPRYVLDRGISLATCREWQLGYDRKSRRLIFPVRNAAGKLVGIIGRTILDGVEPKYKDYLGFPKSRYLYGEHLVSFDGFGGQEPWRARLIVVEGTLDVLRIWSFGIRNVVALMGSEMTSAQAEKIKNIGRPVILGLDWDAAGERGRKRMIYMLKGRLQLWDMKVPVGISPEKKVAGVDPADLTYEQLLESLNSAELIL